MGCSASKTLAQVGVSDLVDLPSTVICGPSTAGKTLLYLRLLHPKKAVSELVSVLRPTATVNVEIFSYAGETTLLWDISGVFMECVFEFAPILDATLIYLVSMLDINNRMLLKHRRAIHRLAALPSTRGLLVLVNTYDSSALALREFPTAAAKHSQSMSDANQATKDECYALIVNRLQLAPLARLVGPKLLWCKADIKAGTSDTHFAEALSTLVCLRRY